MAAFRCWNRDTMRGHRLRYVVDYHRGKKDKSTVSNLVRLEITKNTFKTPNFKSIPWIGYEFGSDSKQQYLPDRKFEGKWPSIKIGDQVELEVTFDNKTFRYVRPVAGSKAVVVIPADTEEVKTSLEERYGEVKAPFAGRRAVAKKTMKKLASEMKAIDMIVDNFENTTSYWGVLANNIILKAYSKNKSDMADKEAIKTALQRMRQVGAAQSLIDDFEKNLSKAATAIGKNDGGAKAILKMTAEFVANPAVSKEMGDIIGNWGSMEKMARMADKSVPLLSWMLANDCVGDADKAKVSAGIETLIGKLVNPSDGARS